MDAKRALALLRKTEEGPRAIGERLGVSTEAVDEAMCLLEEIDTAEVDAILAMPPVLATALLRAAADASRFDALEAAATHDDKVLQKEARRLAHHLRHRGVEITLPTKEAAPAPAVATAPTEDSPLLLSVIDPDGVRRLLWTRPLPGRGVEFADIGWSEEGVTRFAVGNISRKQLRQALQELPESRDTFFAIEREEGERLLGRLRVAIREGAKSPPDFPLWALQALGPIPHEAPAPLGPLGEGAAPAAPAAVQALAASSAALFDEREFLGWYPEEPLLQRLSLRMDEIQNSALLLPGAQGDAQRREAMEAAVQAEAEAYFHEAVRERFALWLSETARLFEIGGKIHQAQVAAATSLRLRDGAPLSEIPFAVQYLRRILRLDPPPPDEAPPSDSGPLIIP